MRWSGRSVGRASSRAGFAAAAAGPRRRRRGPSAAPWSGASASSLRPPPLRSGPAERRADLDRHHRRGAGLVAVAGDADDDVVAAALGEAVAGFGAGGGAGRRRSTRSRSSCSPEPARSTTALKWTGLPGGSAASRPSPAPAAASLCGGRSRCPAGPSKESLGVEVFRAGAGAQEAGAGGGRVDDRRAVGEGAGSSAWSRLSSTAPPAGRWTSR